MTHRLGAGILILISSAACSCTGLPSLEDSNSGIQGVALAGPQCPVQGPGVGDECDDQPYQATIIVRSENGSTEITRFTAEDDGTFRQPLPPGSYLLDPQAGENGFPFADDQLVTVTEGQFTEITILYDTGIR